MKTKGSITCIGVTLEDLNKLFKPSQIIPVQKKFCVAMGVIKEEKKEIISRPMPIEKARGGAAELTKALEEESGGF